MTAGAGDRFRVVRDERNQYVFARDRRGRIREWGSAAAAVRALESAGEDLAAWRIYWQPEGSPCWRCACRASDAGYVFAGR